MTNNTELTPPRSVRSLQEYCGNVKKITISVMLLVCVTACSSLPKLMPTPTLYLEKPYNSATVPVEYRTPQSEILYFTDRAIESDAKPKNNGLTLSYGTGRSSSLAFGQAVVEFSDTSVNWKKLVSASSLAKRNGKFTYRLSQVEELGRLPASPYKFTRSSEGIELSPEVESARAKSIDQLRTHLDKRLIQGESKDVILFIHGFNNTFDDAAYVMAGLWHFLERKGVPMIYTWPAGRGGLTGYFIDRESGEFTIFHLKEAIRILSSMSKVENIHIIAHSRGTDVTTSALRELVIESRAAGFDPRQKLKVKNLVLAAPDLDFGVMQQRLMAEQFGPAIGQITIYTSQQDKALGLSQILMSGLRFGRVRSQDVQSNLREIFANAGNVDFIQVPRTNKFIGHNYFHSNAAVSSDLIQLITKGAKPDSPERALSLQGDNFWQIKSFGK